MNKNNEQILTVLRTVGFSLSKHLDSETINVIVEDINNDLEEEGILPLKD